MKNRLLNVGVMLGIALNIFLLFCLYIVESRVDLLENQHSVPPSDCHK